MNVNVNLPNGTPIAMNFQGVRERVRLPDGTSFLMNFLGQTQRDAYMGYHDQLTAKEEEITQSLPSDIGYFILSGYVPNVNTNHLMEEWLTIAKQMFAHFNHKYSAVIPYWRLKWNDYELFLGKQVTPFPSDYNGDLPLATDANFMAHLNPFP